MDKTILRPAGEWTCDECGRNNFCSFIVPDYLSDEEKREISREMGFDEWEEGELLMAPETVTCTFCKAEFETVE